MRLWSKGLGRQVLPFYLREATSVEEDDGAILIQGRIVERKVNWNYKLHLDADDMLLFTALMARDKTILAFLKKELGWSFIGFVLKRVIVLPFIVIKVLISELVKPKSGVQEEAGDLQKTREAVK